MLKITADYHTHTNFSHGQGTIRENVEAAIARGLQRIAITDHGPAAIGLGVKNVDVLLRMKELIAKYNQEYPEIEILFGVEANIISIDGKLDVPAWVLSEMDIVLAGLHRLILPATLRDAWRYYFYNYLGEKVSKQLAQTARSLNTRAVIAAINNNKIDILTHPGHHFAIDTPRLARACVRRGTALEINASHAYDLEGFVRAAVPTGVNFVINSDAHTPARVGDVEAAIAIVEKVGVPAVQIINAGIAKPLRNI